MATNLDKVSSKLPFFRRVWSVGEYGCGIKIYGQRPFKKMLVMMIIMIFMVIKIMIIMMRTDVD